MNIDNVLVDLVKGWDETIEWTQHELEAVCTILKSISLNNGGNLKYDVELEEKIEEEYSVNTINTALQKVMNLYADSIIQDRSQYYYVPREGITPALDFLLPVEYVPKIDINKADVTELATLPGIGPKTAQRIVEFKDERGGFKNIAELLEIKGIDEKTFNKFRYSIFASPMRDSVSFISPLLLKFKLTPTFSHYVKLIKSTSGWFTLNKELKDAQSFKDMIMAELLKIDEYIKKNYYPVQSRYRRNQASAVTEVFDQHQYVQDMEKRASHDIKGVCVINDKAYLTFVEKLIASAEEKIRIVMFFMRFEDNKKYPTDSLFKELLAAKKRQVDIKVILDRDEEGQIFGSREINEGAYNFFKSNKIEVTYDFDKELTHTKLVLVDDRHVVIGSHNWTAGSFFAYDDKSVYIESCSLADETSRYFDDLWVEYTIGSNAPFLQVRNLEGIESTYIEKLEKEKVYSTLDLLFRTKSIECRKDLSEKTGIPKDFIFKWASVADLMRIKGINEEFAILLGDYGIHTVHELAQKNPESLSQMIDKALALRPYLPKPTLEKVKSWVKQAKDLNQLLEC